MSCASRASRRRWPQPDTYLRERFIPDYNFTRSPADPASAFVPLGRWSTSSRSCARKKSAWWARTTPLASRGCAAARQAARAPDGRGAARPGPPPSRWDLHRLAQCLGLYAAHGALTPRQPARAAGGRFRGGRPSRAPRTPPRAALRPSCGPAAPPWASPPGRPPTLRADRSRVKHKRTIHLSTTRFFTIDGLRDENGMRDLGVVRLGGPSFASPNRHVCLPW